MSDLKRRALLIALIAVILGLMGFIYASIPQDIAFEIVKNNTDLCNFNHTSMLCDGSRQSNVTYYTNDSTIILTVYAHANLASQTAGVFVYRDDILIEAQSGRPLATPEQTWRGVTVILPKNTSYRVNFTNYHHFNWTEDQILSGRNGTLSINQTGGAGCTGDCSFNNLTVNSLGVNSTPDNNIHLLSPLETLLGQTQTLINTQGVFNFLLTNLTTGNGSGIVLSEDSAVISVTNSYNNYIQIFQNRTEIGFLERVYKFNSTSFDMNGAGLVNCSNCGTGTDNTKVNKTGDTMTGVLNMGGSKVINASWVNVTGTLAVTNRSFVVFDGNANMELERDGNTVMRAVAAGTGVNSFGANSAGGNLSNPTAVPNGQIIFNFFAAGYDGSSWSGGRAFIRLYADGNWNTTSHPTKIIFGVTANNTIATAEAFSINNQTNITFNSLTGTGNAYVCVDSTGKLFRGSPGC